MKKQNYLMLLVLAWMFSLACHESGPQLTPQPGMVPLSASDYSFADHGMAKVEELDPSDFDNSNTTHVNYAVAMVTTRLREVQYGDRTFLNWIPTLLPQKWWPWFSTCTHPLA